MPPHASTNLHSILHHSAALKDKILVVMHFLFKSVTSQSLPIIEKKKYHHHYHNFTTFLHYIRNRLIISLGYKNSYNSKVCSGILLAIVVSFLNIQIYFTLLISLVLFFMSCILFVLLVSSILLIYLLNCLSVE